MTPYTNRGTIRCLFADNDLNANAWLHLIDKIRRIKDVRDEEDDYKGSFTTAVPGKNWFKAVSHGYRICGAVLYRLYDNKIDHVRSAQTKIMRH